MSAVTVIPKAPLPGAAQPAGCYEFGPFLLDAESRVLFRRGQMVPITPKMFDLLLALAQRGGKVAGKPELLDQVWPGCFVEEGSLAQHIWRLRRLLDDESGSPLIETVPKRGYRFLGAVRWRPDGGARFHAEEPAAGLSLVPHGPPETMIAVVRVRNLSARAGDEWLSQAFAELISCELGQSPGMRLCPAEVVEEARKALQLPDVASLGARSLAALRERTGCDLAISLSYLVSDRAIRLNAIAQATQTGATVAVLVETAALDEVAALAAKISARFEETFA
jgi:eukaryotic-like serine/threonine-protein kinase